MLTKTYDLEGNRRKICLHPIIRICYARKRFAIMIYVRPTCFEDQSLINIYIYIYIYVRYSYYCMSKKSFPFLYNDYTTKTSLFDYSIQTDEPRVKH